jgi:hypothetical protein
MSADRDLTYEEAKALAKRFKVKLPPVGHEVHLGAKRWLSSTGHHQFGWFGLPKELLPFRVRCACSDHLRPGEERGCTQDCPVRKPEPSPRGRGSARSSRSDSP